MWYVDLAPITDPDLVPVAVIRALGLPDQPGRSTMDTLLRFVGDRRMLLVLDNCEHLLDACAALVVALQGGCPAVTVVATSREPIGVAGEVSWRVPSLSLADEAIELFTDRARRVRPDFRLTDDNAAIAAEICRRLDGVPLAIELAAARVRVMSLTEIRDSLHDRFRLLTGGARTAVRRQQTLRASVDWSHALLTEPERILFARLAVFMGGFDLDAAEAVAGGGDVERFQVLDLLTLLVDKSLVVAESASGRNAIPAAGDGAPVRAGEARRVRPGRRRACPSPRSLHGDGGPARHPGTSPVMSSVSSRPTPRSTTCGPRSRGAARTPRSRSRRSWRRRCSRLWLARGRIREGLTWFDAALTDQDGQPAKWRRRCARGARRQRPRSTRIVGATDSMEQALEALAIAREVDDPALLLRALTACGGIAVYDPEVARPYFAEAIGLARSIGDGWRLEPIFCRGRRSDRSWWVIRSRYARPPKKDATSPTPSVTGSASHGCRWSLGVAQGMTGDLVGAVAQLREVIAEDRRGARPIWQCCALFMQAFMLAYHGDPGAARETANAAVEVATELGGFFPGLAYAGLTVATLAAGDVAAADDAIAAGLPHLSLQPKQAAIWIAYAAQAALARGDLTAARRLADDAVAATSGFHLSLALTTRAGVADRAG